MQFVNFPLHSIPHKTHEKNNLLEPLCILFHTKLMKKKNMYSNLSIFHSCLAYAFLYCSCYCFFFQSQHRKGCSCVTHITAFFFQSQVPKGEQNIWVNRSMKTRKDVNKAHTTQVGLIFGTQVSSSLSQHLIQLTHEFTQVVNSPYSSN